MGPWLNLKRRGVRMPKGGAKESLRRRVAGLGICVALFFLSIVFSGFKVSSLISFVSLVAAAGYAIAILFARWNLKRERFAAEHGFHADVVLGTDAIQVDKTRRLLYFPQALRIAELCSSHTQLTGEIRGRMT